MRSGNQWLSKGLDNKMMKNSDSTARVFRRRRVDIGLEGLEIKKRKRVSSLRVGNPNRVECRCCWLAMVI